MGTRAGDIDTCVAQFIMNKYNMSADDCLTMLNKKSGVLALSDGISSDFRDLDKAAEEGNEAAQLALDKFAYEVRKYIGAYTAALGGLDCLVFTAGVGENSASMRASICEGLECLGVKLDAEKNKTRGEEAVISADDSKVKVWVIPTNEELMIAQDTAALLSSISVTLTQVMSPMFSTSSTFSTRRFSSLEMWIMPSLPGASSTNAPIGRMRTTLP